MVLQHNYPTLDKIYRLADARTIIMPPLVSGGFVFLLETFSGALDV